uniref:DDE Tnp4 domain-containing protein n=1 Tax=Myripristis murdjan TaxID=586833 RepID=A0A667XNS7_9TELE
KKMRIYRRVRHGRRPPRRSPRVWERRRVKDFWEVVVQQHFNHQLWLKHFRMSKPTFDDLCATIGPFVGPLVPSHRPPVPTEKRVAIAIYKYLSTGDSFRTITDSFRVGISAVAAIVPDVASAIWECLVGEFMAVPTTEEWRTNAEEFKELWNLTLCCGAMDGKHIVFKAPIYSGSQFFNYKGTFSIVLLAVVDAKKCFCLIDVGGYGRTSDGGILANSAFGQALRNGTLQLPGDLPLPGAKHRGPQPHVFVTDEAFPLRRNLMRPYPAKGLSTEQRIFNYRISRAHLFVENAFGILSSQWRLYRRAIKICPEVAEACVKATCVLHNFIQRTSQTTAVRGNMNDPVGEVVPLQGLGRVGANNFGPEALRVRKVFAEQFNAEGAVPWLNEAIALKYKYGCKLLSGFCQCLTDITD